MMRNYPRNSPQAAARIVALALLADGHVCRRELGVLDQLAAHEQLGLERQAFHAVVHGFCEDLLVQASMSWDSACRIDPAGLAALMAEIDDPHLRKKVVRLCVQAIEADGTVADGEATVLTAAAEHWGLAPQGAIERETQSELHPA